MILKYKIFIDKSRSIDLYTPLGQKCKTNMMGVVEFYRLMIRSVCDPKIDHVQVSNTEAFDTCNPRLTITSKYCCKAYSYSNWIDELGISKYIIVTILLFFGILFLVAGYNFKELFSVLMISLVGGIILFLLFNSSLDLPIYCKHPLLIIINLLFYNIRLPYCNINNCFSFMFLGKRYVIYS